MLGEISITLVAQMVKHRAAAAARGPGEFRAGGGHGRAERHPLGGAGRTAPGLGSSDRRAELNGTDTNRSDKRKRFAQIMRQSEVDKYRTGGQYADEFPDRWLPGALAIVGEAFTEQNGLVNSTMKVVRGKVEEHFADRIEYVYTPEGKKIDNPKNLESIAQIAK